MTRFYAQVLSDLTVPDALPELEDTLSYALPEHRVALRSLLSAGEAVCRERLFWTGERLRPPQALISVRPQRRGAGLTALPCIDGLTWAQDARTSFVLSFHLLPQNPLGYDSAAGEVDTPCATDILGVPGLKWWLYLTPERK